METTYNIYINKLNKSKKATGLTPRQVEVLDYILAGYSQKEIAQMFERSNQAISRIFIVIKSKLPHLDYPSYKFTRTYRKENPIWRGK